MNAKEPSEANASLFYRNPAIPTLGDRNVHPYQHGMGMTKLPHHVQFVTTEPNGLEQKNIGWPSSNCRPHEVVRRAEASPTLSRSLTWPVSIVCCC